MGSAVAHVAGGEHHLAWRENSLSIVFLLLFLGALAGQAYAGWQEFQNEALSHLEATIWLSSWSAQSVTGWSDYNSDQLAHGEAARSWWQFVGTADLWEATLQNWQSEFLAVGSMAVLAIYLRQRGSPESKPVGAPHTATGTEG